MRKLGLRFSFIFLLALAIQPSSFAQKKLKKFNNAIMKGINKTKGNDHIYKKDGRAPSSVDVEFNWSAPVGGVDDYERYHLDIKELRKRHLNGTGVGAW